MSERKPHWWCTNRVPNNVTRTQLPQFRWFILFLARAFAPTTNDHIQSFSSQPLILCLWLPNQANLVDKTSGANLQADGHADVSAQSERDLQEPEEEDSSPSCWPS